MELVSLVFLKSVPGGEFNAGEIGGVRPDKAERFISRGFAKLYEGPQSEPEPQPAKKKPKGLERLDRMAKPEADRG